MFKNLSPGAIGIRDITLPDAIKLAQQSGFAGIDFNIREAAALAQAHDLDYVRNLFAEAGIRPAQWGMPVPWNREEGAWRDGLAELPALAEVGRALGSLRSATWCPPNSTERAFAENFKWHVARFKPIAEIMRDHGIRFGIEFIGPQSLRPPDKHAFIYSMEGMLELAEAIGTGNVGLLLDAWHLYTSGGTLADLDKLGPEEIVTVHVNDAPPGLSMAEYNDHDRRLPMESGVIPLPGFMQKLIKIGYEGPVTPEPFSQRVNAIADPLEAAQLTASYMAKLWAASGLE
jgi:sugar phosphate isomerase/epimerase